MIVTEVESGCDCGFTTANIEDASFQCFVGSDNAVTYRARLKGTATHSYLQLIELLVQWIASDGVIRVHQTLMTVDKACEVAIDSFNDPECNSGSDGRDVTVIEGTVVATLITISVVLIIIAICLIKRRKTKTSIAHQMAR